MGAGTKSYGQPFPRCNSLFPRITRTDVLHWRES